MWVPSTSSSPAIVTSTKISSSSILRLRCSTLIDSDKGVVERVVGLLRTVGINYVDALQVAVGGRYTELDTEWNVRAHWETAGSPKIVNWRGQIRHHGNMALVP